MHDIPRLSFGNRQTLPRNPMAFFPGYPRKVRLNYISATRLVRLMIRKGI